MYGYDHQEELVRMENGYPVHDNDAPLQIFVAGFIAEPVDSVASRSSFRLLSFLFLLLLQTMPVRLRGVSYTLLKSPATFVFLLELDSSK